MKKVNENAKVVQNYSSLFEKIYKLKSETRMWELNLIFITFVMAIVSVLLIFGCKIPFLGLFGNVMTVVGTVLLLPVCIMTVYILNSEKLNRKYTFIRNINVDIRQAQILLIIEAFLKSPSDFVVYMKNSKKGIVSKRKHPQKGLENKTNNKNKTKQPKETQIRKKYRILKKIKAESMLIRKSSNPSILDIDYLIEKIDEERKALETKKRNRTIVLFQFVLVTAGIDAVKNMLSYIMWHKYCDVSTSADSSLIAMIASSTVFLLFFIYLFLKEMLKTRYSITYGALIRGDTHGRNLEYALLILRDMKESIEAKQKKEQTEDSKKQVVEIQKRLEKMNEKLVEVVDKCGTKNMLIEQSQQINTINTVLQNVERDCSKLEGKKVKFPCKTTHKIRHD